MHLGEKFCVIWDAIRGEWHENYPSDDIIVRINGKLKDIDFSGKDPEQYLKLGRESLNEVKSLTEYQDGKTARLLTIIAFLTAAAGVVFSKILDIYPLHHSFRLDAWGQAILVGFVYLLFVFFLILVAIGSLVSFHAMRTRFFWKDEGSKDVTGTSVKSLLFFRSIVAASPEAWADAFVDPANPTHPSPKLAEKYYRNCVVESYLVAAKLCDKIRYLEHAQDLLLWSIKVLILWILVLAFAVIFVPTSEHSDYAIAERTNIGQNVSPAITGSNASLKEIPASGVIAEVSGGAAPASGVIAAVVHSKKAPSKHMPHKRTLCKCADSTLVPK